MLVGYMQFKDSLENKYKRVFWEEQLKTCVSLVRAASVVAQKSDSEIPQDMIDSLYHLYFGAGILTLNIKTVDMARKFVNIASDCKNKRQGDKLCERREFNEMAFRIAESCRNNLVSSWELPLKKLGQDQLKFNL